MRTIILLGEEIVDASKVSFVSGFDKDIKHDIKAATTIFFFNIVVDGHLIKIQSHESDTLKQLRLKLVDIITNL